MADVLRQYLKSTPCFITCSGRLDGPGAQTHAIISTMIVAKFLGFTYVHSPMSRIAHNEENIKKEKWESQWNTFFNLAESEMTIDEHKKLYPGTKIVPITMSELDRYSQRSLERVLKKNFLYVVKKSHEITQKYFEHPDMQAAYHKVLSAIIKRFHSTPKPVLSFYNQSPNTPKKLHVAIHSRRGDVARGNQIITHKRFTDNAYFYQVMLNIERILTSRGLPYQIHLFSEGSLKLDFPELYWIDRELNEASLRDNHQVNGQIIQFNQPIRVHLNGNPMHALHHLISADVIVMAKSCYSYIAGLYNDKSIKMYTDFWFKPQLNWIKINENAQFNTLQFENGLTGLTGLK